MMSIITVNFRSQDELTRLLESLALFEATTAFEHVVVNNDPTENLAALKTRFPKVIWVEAGKNLGYGVACNLGRTHATGAWLAFVNPDVAWTQPVLQRLETTLQAEKGVGIAGIRLQYQDGTPQPSVRRFPRARDLLALLLKIPHLFPSVEDQWYWRDFDYDKEQDVQQVMGAFFVMQTDLFDTLTGFDPRFFLWYDEVDLCKRTIDAGWRIKYFPSFLVAHGQGRSFAKVGTWKKQAYVRTSIRQYARKHFPFLVWPVFYLGEPLFFLLSLLASVWKK